MKEHKMNTTETKTTDVSLIAALVEQLDGYIKLKLDDKPGMLSLEQIQRAFPKVEKYSIVKALKQSAVADFLVGRRGHASRVATPKGQKHEASAPKAQAAKQRLPVANSGLKNYAFRMRIGEHQIEVPITTSLVQV